jgi:hypothetical protein
MNNTTTSLTGFFKTQAIRWAAVGFLLTLLFAVPCILYSAKLSSERQLLISAKTTARAFRTENEKSSGIKTRRIGGDS